MPILHGDLFDVLPTWAENSVDACVTDPPYGIGFMGREWDTFTPAKTQADAQGKLRKSFRMDHSGNRYDGYQQNPNTKGRKRSPAMSPSQIEYDRTLRGQREFQAWTERWAREVLRVLKPGAHAVVCGAPRSYHRMACGLEDAGFVIRDGLSWLYGQGFPKSLNLGDGLGTALKPGWEPIILAWKPFKGTTTQTHAKYGTAALNIDACRLAGSDGDGHWSADDGSDETSQPGYEGGFTSGGEKSNVGRWPANAMLDEDAAAMLDEQSGALTSGANPTRRGSDKFRGIYSEFKGEESCIASRGLDVGGASRFFYVAKPSREERDLGCDLIQARQRDESRKEGNPGGDNPRNRGLQPRGNFHPTVKPLALMRWLVRLVTPKGGCVLDPFGGSGTTGMACAAEGLDFTLIEKEAEYIAIIEARIRAIAPLFSY